MPPPKRAVPSGRVGPGLTVDRPFEIEEPAALREQVRVLARRLAAYADADPVA